MYLWAANIVLNPLILFLSALCLLLCLCCAPASAGPVFGNMNQFTGLGVFVDTYPNSDRNHDVSIFTYLTVVWKFSSEEQMCQIILFSIWNIHYQEKKIKPDWVCSRKIQQTECVNKLWCNKRSEHSLSYWTFKLTNYVNEFLELALLSPNNNCLKSVNK